MILEQKRRIIKREDQIVRWSQKHHAAEQRAGEAKVGYELKLAKQRNKTSELEIQNVTLIREAAEARSNLKQERENAQKLRLEHDRLQKELSQQRSLAEEEERIAQRTRGTFNGVVEGFVENTIRDLTADIERACNYLRNGRDAFVRNGNHHLPEDHDLRGDLRNARSGERVRGWQNDAANPTVAECHAAHSTTGAASPPDTSTVSRRRKRGTESTNDQPEKRIKSEVADNWNDPGEGQRKEAGKSVSTPTISSVRLTQPTTLDPRLQAVVRRHSVIVPQSTLRSL